ncbi:MAG: DNA-binding response regulator [Cyanobacteria bacterium PR.023]|jgi:OmpR-family two-component system manganese-sensing response regulator|nr:DNA-binding response regulator [Cyanobacteria bacterium PR.023]MDQ5935707.1 two-component system, OmpR family, manganese sensing response regulator [Cyanobacteriota bacterium erpe_2018_sw_21hr_WHONDRS-SW48-000092_B_bin.40]
MPQILFVEDDKDLSAVVNEWLTADGYTVEVAHDGLTGWEFLRQYNYDVVILDWNLPGLSGPEMCNRYRAGGGVAPVIMLTAKSQITEKMEGFDSGVDDYLTKPFNLKELSARLRALLRRPQAVVTNVISNGYIELDVVKRRITKGGVEVHLLPRDFELLEFLMRHLDEVFSSEALLQRIWGSDAEATSDALRTSIKRLRQKLDVGDSDAQSFIENIPRVGYRLRRLT